MNRLYLLVYLLGFLSCMGDKNYDSPTKAIEIVDYKINNISVQPPIENTIATKPENNLNIIDSTPDSTPTYGRFGGGGGARKRDTTCGNNVLDFNEDCDDGNRLDFDGCSKKCKFEAGFPICLWECSSPQCDPLICDPVCEPPKCRTECEEPQNSPGCVCDLKCEKPECEIKCEDACTAGDCPSCVTICKKPHCVSHCQNTSGDPQHHCQPPTPDCNATCDEAECLCKCHYPTCEPTCELNCQ